MTQLRAGLGYGLGAYLLWGAFPLYFTLISAVDPLEIVPWRVITTFVVCAILVVLAKRWNDVVRILRTPRLLGAFVISSLLIYTNWQIYVTGVVTGHILETSLGYFINPLFTILLGVIFWKERLTTLQWVSVGIASLGVITAAIAYGSVPWISLGLALTFGLYGVMHRRMEQVDGVTGLAVETLVSAPLGVVQAVWLASVAGFTAFSHGTGVAILVLASGIATAVPLIFFAESARRLPLSYLGFLQFITPVLGFLFGLFVMHEEVSVARWIGFIAVWIALVVLMVDMVRRVRSPRIKSPESNSGVVRLD